MQEIFGNKCKDPKMLRNSREKKIFERIKGILIREV
jgi:hypothetical protein